MAAAVWAGPIREGIIDGKTERCTFCLRTRRHRGGSGDNGRVVPLAVVRFIIIFVVVFAFRVAGIARLIVIDTVVLFLVDRDFIMAGIVVVVVSRIAVLTVMIHHAAVVFFVVFFAIHWRRVMWIEMRARCHGC